jgi:hypothetical protein
MRILMAAKINRRTGAQVKPWEIDDVPDEFLDAFKAFDDVAVRKQSRTVHENLFRKFRKKHGYRRYLN